MNTQNEDQVFSLDINEKALEQLIQSLTKFTLENKSITKTKHELSLMERAKLKIEIFLIVKDMLNDLPTSEFIEIVDRLYNYCVE